TMQHQNLPHREMFSPLVKWTGRPGVNEIPDALHCALQAVETLPHGPVHLDLSTDVTSAPARDFEPHSVHRANDLPTPDGAYQGVPPIVRNAKRPLFLIGLGARSDATARALRDICYRFAIPALVTYKAKGVVPDRHEWFGGIFTNGTLEREVVEQADLLIAVGLDPVELLP